MVNSRRFPTLLFHPWTGPRHLLNRTDAVSFNFSLLVMMGLFWVVYLILRVFFFKPMMALMEERRSRVESAQALYDESFAETESRIAEERARLSEARSQAMASRDQERRQAQARRQEQLNEIKAQAQEALGKAAAELEEAVGHERTSLEQKAQDIADRITETLLGRPV